MQRSSTGADSASSASPPSSVNTNRAALGERDAPRLLWELTPWYREFFGNAFDLIFFRFRQSPAADITSAPARFWPDVFVPRTFPTAALRLSALCHIFVAVALWGFSQTWITRPRTVETRSPFEQQTITYYSVSEYLPPIGDTREPAPAKEEKKGDPEYSKQRIVSIPRSAESRTQTVVAPPHLKLQADVPLPNMVAWTPVPAAVPLAAATHSADALAAPPLTQPVEPAPQVARSSVPLDLSTAVVQPPPDVDNAKLRTPADLAINRAVVEPPPEIVERTKSPNLPLASAVEAAPSLHNVRRSGDINIAQTDTNVPAPRLPVIDQRASGSFVPPRTRPTGATVRGASAQVRPPAVAMPGQAGGSQAVGQILALGTRPALLRGPITIPQGNRAGTFAAGPEGKPGATGTPDIKAVRTTAAGNGSGSGTGSGTRSGTPIVDGLTVERGAHTPGPGVVVAGTPKPATSPQKNTFASLIRPNIAHIARSTAPGSPPVATPSKIEDEVFGGKKYYSMTLNMPNLVSASGSWIIRFAELHVGKDRGELTAPVAMQKVDPAYPTELMRQRVEGTVVLYAVIHADGSVAGVRVLRGVDDRLDQNARVALMKWRFRPGTKNGSAVDLEAVVQIPFVARELTF
ncbi:MAG TPA: TonB family protein [Terriglobales bacterium]|nr:TonB family protein [Terriglobales bacterium]